MPNRQGGRPIDLIAGAGSSCNGYLLDGPRLGMYGMNEELKIQTPNMALFEKIDKTSEHGARPGLMKKGRAALNGTDETRPLLRELILFASDGKMLVGGGSSTNRETAFAVLGFSRVFPLYLRNMSLFSSFDTSASSIVLKPELALDSILSE